MVSLNQLRHEKVCGLISINSCQTDLRRSAKLTPSWQDGSWWSTFLHSLSSSKWLLNRYWSSCSCLRVYRSLNRRMKISDLWITFILLDKLLFQQDVQWTKYWLWFAEHCSTAIMCYVCVVISTMEHNSWCYWWNVSMHNRTQWIIIYASDGMFSSNS